MTLVEEKWWGPHSVICHKMVRLDKDVRPFLYDSFPYIRYDFLATSRWILCYPRSVHTLRCLTGTSTLIIDAVIIFPTGRANSRLQLGRVIAVADPAVRSGNERSRREQSWRRPSRTLVQDNRLDRRVLVSELADDNRHSRQWTLQLRVFSQSGALPGAYPDI